jgi:hypothetical protein
VSAEVATGDDVALHADVACLADLIWLQTADVVDDVVLES